MFEEAPWKYQRQHSRRIFRLSQKSDDSTSKAIRKNHLTQAPEFVFPQANQEHKAKSRIKFNQRINGIITAFFISVKNYMAAVFPNLVHIKILNIRNIFLKII